MGVYKPQVHLCKQTSRPGPGSATKEVLGGSWVVISRVISRVTILITYIRGLITLLITTPEPPSRPETLYPYRIPIDPFKGTLQGTLITSHEPPSRELKFWGPRAQGIPAREDGKSV